jgi:hypothetical protein
MYEAEERLFRSGGKHKVVILQSAADLVEAVLVQPLDLADAGSELWAETHLLLPRPPVG